MQIEHRMVAVAALFWAAAASAQVPGAAAAAAAPAGPVADKAALERAQQLADGPRRRILEAAKLKTAARAPDLPTPAATMAAVPAAPAPLATAAAVVPQAALPRPAEPPPALATLHMAVAPLPVANAAATAVPAVAPMELTAGSTALISLPSPAPALNLASLPPPRLVSKVDPDLPSRVFRRGAGRTEVTVDLVVNADGSVRDIALRPGTNPEFEPAIVDAVRQWKYEPQPTTRPHTVRLVVAPG